jgi:hypothetical protein
MQRKRQSSRLVPGSFGLRRPVMTDDANQVCVLCGPGQPVRRRMTVPISRRDPTHSSSGSSASRRPLSETKFPWSSITERPAPIRSVPSPGRTTCTLVPVLVDRPPQRSLDGHRPGSSRYRPAALTTSVSDRPPSSTRARTTPARIEAIERSYSRNASAALRRVCHPPAAISHRRHRR